MEKNRKGGLRVGNTRRCRGTVYGNEEATKQHDLPRLVDRARSRDGLSIHSVPILGFTIGVFLKSLSQEFSWSRTQISLAITLSALGMTLAAPFLGWLVDRFGARRVILPAVGLFGGSVLSLYFLSAHLWHFYAIFLFTGIVGSGTGPVPYMKVISQWFDRRRGLALGLAMIGSSAGTFIMPSLAQALISSMGWRSAYVFLGLLPLGITLHWLGCFSPRRRR